MQRSIDVSYSDLTGVSIYSKVSGRTVRVRYPEDAKAIIQILTNTILKEEENNGIERKETPEG